VSRETQSIVFNALPLLALAVAYLGVTASLAPTLWRQRARIHLIDFGVLLTFPSLAVMAAVWGIVVLHDRAPIGGHVWPPFAGSLVGFVPIVLMLLRWRETRFAATGPIRARVEEERRTLRDRELEASSHVSTALTRTDDAEGVARVLLDELIALFQLDFAALSLLSEDGREAIGLLARTGTGDDAEWWPDVRIDLEHEPSGIASAAFEAAPFAVFDVEGSGRISRRLADRVGAKSAAYVPLMAKERVIAVISLATTRERRAFTTEELSLMQALAAEAATALDRARSSAALARALERERLVTTIARKLRSELDLDAVLDVAVAETGRALGVARCFIRLGSEGVAMPVAAEWHAEGVAQLAAGAEHLPVSNLALREKRTITIGDVADSRELADPSLGSRELLLELGTRAALATPLVVLDDTVGVLALHRATPGPWDDSEVALAEAVAHEAGLALHIARLLEQNRERIGRQTSLLRAAQVLTGDLELESVLERLADQVAVLLAADAADCYLYDAERGVLRCAAVHGLPEEMLGFEFPVGRGLAAIAIEEGRAVAADDYDRLADPVPHSAYVGFTHALVAPMRWSGETRGVLGVGLRGGSRRFSEAETEVLEAFAGLASLAIRNAETFTQSMRQARVQRGFYRIASVLGQSLSRAATLDAVAQAAAEALGGDFAAVLAPAGRRLELTGSFELPERLAAFLRVDEDRQAALTRSGTEGRVIAAPDVGDDERFGDDWRRLAGEIPYVSLLCVPVEQPRGDAGIVVVVFFAERRVFTDDDLDLARHLADAARGALERSALFEAERTSRTLAQQLARTGGVLATELDPDAVVDEVVQQAPALLDADGCAIRVLEADELVVSAAVGDGATAAVGSRSSAAGWLSGDVVQSRAPVAVANAAEDRRYVDVDVMVASGQCAYLGVPLVGPEGALHGVLAVYARRPREWREEEVEALRALAANTSAALSNAELYQRVAIEKERSYAILANIADGIVAVDREGRVVLWNAAAEQITGVPADEALGHTTTEVLQRTLESETGTPQGDRIVSIQRNGEDVWLSLTEAVMRDPAGAVAGRIFAFRDISADRFLEQMKSDFVSTVSHELRAPLTSIYGFAETLLRQDVLFGEDERRVFLGYIASESQRLTDIVDALLNVARLDAGDLQVNLAPTNVADVVREVVAGMSDGNGHRFVVDLPEEPIAAEADRDKLRQVFSILVDNAVKYSPEGGTVTVGAKLNGNAVELRVVDEGPGIPEAERARIFRKFYRAGERDRPGGAGGTGLGLFIAQGLVAAMGGRIWVTSGEGEGSSFGFELPLAAVVEQAQV
jgi:PAS domain S-box-containing protein